MSRKDGKSEKGWREEEVREGVGRRVAECRYPLSREVSPMMNSWHEQKEC